MMGSDDTAQAMCGQKSVHFGSHLKMVDCRVKVSDTDVLLCGSRTADGCVKVFSKLLKFHCGCTEEHLQ